MHPLPNLASWLRRLDPWSMIYSTVSKLKICLMPPPHRQFYHFFTSRPFFPPLLSSFQTRCLSASRMAEDNLEMGKGAVGQIWDWSKLISPWLIKTDQKAGSSSARIQTMDLWEPEGKPWQEWNCFFFHSFKAYISPDWSSSHVLHAPPLACSICPLKPVGVWDPWVGVEKGVHWVQAARKSYFSSQLRATGHDIGFAIIFSYDHDQTWNLSKNYTTGFLCQKFYTLKMCELGLILPKIKQLNFNMNDWLTWKYKISMAMERRVCKLTK